jgi:hypothetical protein
LYDEVMEGEVNTKDQIFMVMHETHNSKKMHSLVATRKIWRGGTPRPCDKNLS